MIKPLTLVVLAGVAGAPSFADQLKAGVAMPPPLVPAVSRPTRHPNPGDDDAASGSAGPLWAQSDVGLYYVGHKHRYEGGEGGEGGEGWRTREGGEGGEGGEGRYHHRGRAGPPHHGLPPIIVPCGSKEHAGTLLGAAIGGLLGSQHGKGDGKVAAVAAGTFLGMFLGREVGAYLDVTDEGCARDAAQRAGTAPLGTPIRWNNPETGHSGTVTPVREGRRDNTGQYCREYQQTVIVGGRVEEAYGRACRQPDGSWRILQ